MKTAPADIDREAARLFRVEVRMRAFTEHGRGTVIDVEPCGTGADYVSLVGESDREVFDHVVAIDTDDPATVGVMLAQVRAASGQPYLHVVASDPDPDGAVWWSVPRRFAGRSALSRTEGAALVAVMRALRASTHAWPRES